MATIQNNINGTRNYYTIGCEHCRRISSFKAFGCSLDLILQRLLDPFYFRQLRGLSMTPLICFRFVLFVDLYFNPIFELLVYFTLKFVSRMTDFAKYELMMNYPVGFKLMTTNFALVMTHHYFANYLAHDCSGRSIQCQLLRPCCCLFEFGARLHLAFLVVAEVVVVASPNYFG